MVEFFSHQHDVALLKIIDKLSKNPAQLLQLKQPSLSLRQQPSFTVISTKATITVPSHPSFHPALIGQMHGHCLYSVINGVLQSHV